jgi:hypothetical protein
MWIGLNYLDFSIEVIGQLDYVVVGYLVKELKRAF